MGWNTLRPTRSDPILENLPDDPRFYFVHSYHVLCSSFEDVLATTSYGYEFISVVRHENILGMQFHPEKSHKFGMALLRNFVELI
jgi:glutamine amidotransferase